MLNMKFTLVMHEKWEADSNTGALVALEILPCYIYLGFWILILPLSHCQYPITEKVLQNFMKIKRLHWSLEKLSNDN